MLKSKIGSVQEVILPDFPDDDNTVTATVTKSRRVSFGTNFVKEFIVGSAVSAQCMSEYEQASPSSDSSSANSSHSTTENEILDRSTFVMHDIHRVHKSVTTVSQPCETDSAEHRPKVPPKFSSTICFSADSPTADMEFTEGCLTLAKSILDKKNKEMTLIIQAKAKEPRDEEKHKENETKYFNDDVEDESDFEMSMTRCLKTTEANEREIKMFESENRWEESKENQMPLDMIIRHLDKDNSDLDNEVFSSEKSFNSLLNGNPFDFSNESEDLNFNESVDMSIDLQPNFSMGLPNSAPPIPKGTQIAVSPILKDTQNSPSPTPKGTQIAMSPVLKGTQNAPSPTTPKGTQISVSPVLKDIQNASSPTSKGTQIGVPPVVKDIQISESPVLKGPQNAVPLPKVPQNVASPVQEVPEIVTCNREPSLIDVKVIENLNEQSKEPGCVWSLKDFLYPDNSAEGLIFFNCKLLDSSVSICFNLQTSQEDSLYTCSVITNSSIRLNEERQWRLPEYQHVIQFGFQQLNKHYEELGQKVETIRHIPYFLDQINSFMVKLNLLLQQIFSILTLYPGSTLKGSLLSFRLFSFPIFFSCIVSIDLRNLFRLSKSSLLFENDFGSLDENKIREIFQDCLKCENLLCEFVVQSTKYLIDLEKESGYVSKRGHIRLLPPQYKL